MLFNHKLPIDKDTHEAIVDLKCAICAVHELMDSRDMDYLSDKYPFDYAFDEVAADIIEWCDDMLSKIEVR